MHIDVAPGLLLSQKTMAGKVLPLPPYGQHGGTRLRLFVSPVKPCGTQFGIFAGPLSTLVLTAIVAPALNVAPDPPPSPYTPNSDVVQPFARPSTLSPLTAFRFPPGGPMMIGAEPPDTAVPVNVNCGRLESGCAGTATPLTLFFQQ